MFKEQKIATYSSPGKRIQLLKLTEELEQPSFSEEPYWIDEKYQIRINRKIIKTEIYESRARKKFASLVISEILQQKFTF